MKLSVVIPVYNEIDTFLEMLRRVKAVSIKKEIIVVDDFSTDGTRELLEGLDDKSVKVIFNEKNMGKGSAIRRGFEHVTGDIVIIQDADLEYYPDEYPLLIQKIVEGKADVVYGTRFMGAHRVFHFYHYLGNTFLNLITNIIYNTNLTDLMTCYKAIRADILKTMNLRADGFGIEAEITAQVFKRKLRVYEVPISYDGRDYDEGKKINWKDFFRSLYWLIKCKFEVYDMGEDTLYRMRMMKNNNKWLFDLIKPFLGKSILEIGSGIGNFSKFLTTLRKEKVVLTDIKQSYIDYLNHRFGANPAVKVLMHNIAADNTANIKGLNIDTVICINVLEHIEEDDKVLENINNTLCDNGHLFLVVPAFQWLYGTLDMKLEHKRRYGKKELINKLEQHGFTIEKISYHNIVSVLGWYINGRILKKKSMSNFQLMMFDRFIPFFALMEKLVFVPFGMSLIAVARKSK